MTDKPASRKKTSAAKSATASSARPDNAKTDVQPRKAKARKPGEDGLRETIESIAIAFILAFMFKTFQAEAYVIPTGSMAPTLYGRHKEVTCDGCGFSFAVGASSEVDQSTGELTWRMKSVFCSNCGKQVDAKDAPVFNGDRILVNKQIPEFQRFDVVVFKNPEQGHVNYIKRLVGLPNETIRIRKGDIWARSNDGAPWQIQRKENPAVQKDIQLTVYDDNYPAVPLLEMGWPERWEPSVSSTVDGSIGGWLPTANDWSADRVARTYRFDAQSEDLQWLRYRHFMPNETTWPQDDQLAPDVPSAAPILITDFCSFNAYDVGSANRGAPHPTGIYWTGDLTINAQVDIQQVGDNAVLVLQLVEGPQTFSCTIELNTGTATLTQAPTDALNQTVTMATAQTTMQGSDFYDLAFANVDDRLCLWVDGDFVDFGEGAQYSSSDVPQPTQHDLAPCGLAVRNATLNVSDLLLERDIYYRNEMVEFDAEQGRVLNEQPQHEVRSESQLQSLIAAPEAWAKVYREEVEIQLSNFSEYGEYKLASDEYLMFGDNSSMSKDSRLFDYYSRPMNEIYSHRYAVREQDLIGKALYIFWPHGVPFLNDGEGFAVRSHWARQRKNNEWMQEDLDAENYPRIRFPFYPDVSRMKKIY